jgi:hypothetical protein
VATIKEQLAEQAQQIAELRQELADLTAKSLIFDGDGQAEAINAALEHVFEMGHALGAGHATTGHHAAAGRRRNHLRSVGRSTS